MSKKIKGLIIVLVLILLSSCSSNKEKEMVNEATTDFEKDIRYLQAELPKKHPNLFFNISEEKFNAKIEEVIENSGEMNKEEQQIALEQILSLAGDAHTNSETTDGSMYPLDFTIIDEEIYIINANEKYQDMLFSKVLSIDGVDSDTILQRLETIIPHENQYWVAARVPRKLRFPSYLFGLSIVKEKASATFTVEKDGIVRSVVVKPTFYIAIKFVNTQSSRNLLDQYDRNYVFDYYPEEKTLLFSYNSCMEMSEPFEDFNKKMFQCMEENDVNRIILDVRNNVGGNSEVLNPFTEKLPTFIEQHPDTKVFILVGRRTFSGGMFAIFRTKDAVPDAIIVGENTGGALSIYAEIDYLDLPCSEVPVSCSTKYYRFSEIFAYQNKGVDTCEPDVQIGVTIEDFIEGKDPVLDYALRN